MVIDAAQLEQLRNRRFTACNECIKIINNGERICDVIMTATEFYKNNAFEL